MVMKNSASEETTPTIESSDNGNPGTLAFERWVKEDFRRTAETIANINITLMALLLAITPQVVPVQGCRPASLLDADREGGSWQDSMDCG